MRFSLILCLTATMLGRAVAQTDLLVALPNCTVQCFQTSISNTSCSPTDIPCLCGDQTFQSCTIKEILTFSAALLNHSLNQYLDICLGTQFGLLSHGSPWNGQRLLDDPIPRHRYDSQGNYFNATRLKVRANCVVKLLYVAEIFYMFAEMLVQMSLLAFYIRVFPEASLFVRRSSWTLIAIVGCFGIANTCTMIFQCTPIPFFWSGWAGEMTGKCIDINLFSWMSWKKKAQVLLMFALGFVITVVSILRLQSLIQFAKTSNPTYDNSPAIYWSVLECDMFIICACLPALRSVLSKLAPRFFGTTRKKSYPSGDYYRHEGSNQDSELQVSSHHMRSLDSSGKITKCVDVDVTQEQRTASDEDLVYPPRSYYLSDT
ncbi:uncharacterized protein NECHADRAFT_87371 [Fusarium vanettenii 77-13-4]|uniref:Uncharacterized protein n=1 Tax=Fusarium vanettenii (strain ATCC MYA-4622 / CBS 123669 / FGSC 9596 / NRRL 45880 / 77-13-4) TaxID=660122 RepID=C7ZE32_FUSV7|nr:uncharacterized protein NECHADRAFT_87371 [Fusarium vanettenii 77-13-4]EEU37535.1 hypothetical protein NECHADRAFT_87371 [Fusarium vanettenii 77-13-4]